MSDHAIGVLGLVVGVFGIFVGLGAGYYFYIKARERVIPRYLLNYGPLLGQTSDAARRVSFLFDGEKIENLNRCLLVLWNKGSRTLLRSAVVESDRIRIVFPEKATALGAGVVKSTRAAIALGGSIDEDGRSVVVDFDFLDKDDGGVIEILYQGDPGCRPVVTGSIRGVPGGLRSPIFGDVLTYDDNEDPSTWRGWIILLVTLVVFGGCSGFVFGITYPLTVIFLTLLGAMLSIAFAVRVFTVFLRRTFKFPQFVSEDAWWETRR